MVEFGEYDLLKRSMELKFGCLALEIRNPKIVPKKEEDEYAGQMCS